VSIGVASAVPRRGASAEALVESADHAMYLAKDAGRNRTRLAA
jgi:diguanylate cyclase (GGDEF)-like protein